ncbi:MAG: 1,4-dihydroxy-2-naphthoate octaprenyltransferase [Akkermansiaceae bacterium]|jgi:1,4-dihydroxy-2-naphthoate octaprenyltransferase|tara:strand:- start:350 stop:1207 length:858 start_codon:yes stop_codon:yes gene_type:complete
MMKSWFLASRPKTLPAALVPVWSGALLAWQLTGEFDLRLAILTVLGAVFIQIATNFFNDVIDAEKGADTEARLGPQRATASGLLSRRAVYLGAGLMLLLASIVGWLLFLERGWWIIAIGVPSLYLSYGYTGGPLPLAYRGLGEVFVILFFGLIAVGGTVFIQTGQWLAESWILGLQIGFLSAALIAINNYRDLEEDRAVQKRTIVVRFGRPKVKMLILAMTVLPYLLILAHEISGWFITASIPGLLFFVIVYRLISPSRVPAALLGIAALHLIVFVLVQNIVMIF